LTVAAIACRFFVGAVFLLAGLSKLPRGRDFVAVIRAYEVLPASWASPVSWVVPRVEILVGSLLLVGLWIRPVSLAACGSLVVFTIAVAINLLRGKELDCGCFAVGTPRRITWSLVGRNATLIAATALAAASAPTALALDDVFGAGRSSVGESDAFALLVAPTVAVLIVSLISEGVRLVRMTAKVAA
jgi:uncharacterized membrane protein YphA (DoxX/SURF4 family)